MIILSKKSENCKKSYCSW